MSQSYLGQTKSFIKNKTVVNGCYKASVEKADYLKMRCEELNITAEYFFNTQICYKWIGIVPPSFREPFEKMLLKDGWVKINLTTFKKEYSLAIIETISASALRITSYVKTENKISPNWTAKEKQDFLTSCTTEAKKSIPSSSAKTYCDCMLEKVSLKYSSIGLINMPTSESEIYTRACLKSMGY